MTLWNVAATAIANVPGATAAEAESKVTEILERHGFDVIMEKETFESEAGTHPTELD